MQLAPDGQYVGGNNDVLVQNYNAFQKRINEMKMKAEAIAKDDSK